MLCYAWDILSLKDDVRVGSDDYDDAYNLLSSVFSFGIGKLIRSGFHRSYVEKTEEIATVRGRIDIQQSINALSMQRQKLVCTYDEYSSNDIFNQILKFTIDLLLRNPEVDVKTKKSLKKQRLFFEGIESVAPTKSNRNKLIFNRNNIAYRLLISIAVMLYDNTTINEEDGSNTFKDFFRQEHMHKIFEMFILNFYKIHLNRKTYEVHAPYINWPIDNNATEIWGAEFDIDEDPGNRRTDIVIENKDINLQMIFDAKYYQDTFVNAYMNPDEQRTRTTHLNQIRGYLIDSKHSGKKVGALLYPMVNNDLTKGKVHPIMDTPIIVKTINLNTEWRNIEADMLDFLQRIEKTQQR